MPAAVWHPTVTKVPSEWVPLLEMFGANFIESPNHAGQMEFFLSGQEGWAWMQLLYLESYYTEYMEGLQGQTSILTRAGLMAFAWERMRSSATILDQVEQFLGVTEVLLAGMPPSLQPSSHPRTLQTLRAIGMLPVTLDDMAKSLKDYKRAEPLFPDIDDTDAPEVVHEDGYPF